MLQFLFLYCFHTLFKFILFKFEADFLSCLGFYASDYISLPEFFFQL